MTNKVGIGGNFDELAEEITAGLVVADDLEVFGNAYFGDTTIVSSSLDQFILSGNEPNGWARLDENGNLPGAIIARRDTASNLGAIVLQDGELATTSDTGELRIGDGATNGGVGFHSGNSPTTVWAQATGTPTENGIALKNAHEAAKSLTPNGSALSTTNRSSFRVAPGVYDLTLAGTSLDLDTSFVDVFIDPGAVIITNAGGYQIIVSADDIAWKGGLIRYTQVGTTSNGAFKFTNSTNSNLNIEDVKIVVGGVAATATSINLESLTSLGGSYKNITANTPNIFGAGTTAMTVSATFENVSSTGTASTALGSGNFGGTTDFGSTAPNIFTGSLINCRVANARVGLVMRGTMERCVIRCNRTNQVGIHAGNGGKFWDNRIWQTSTGSYSIGYFESATISAAGNKLRANAIDTGSGITNNIDTAYNVADNDWS